MAKKDKKKKKRGKTPDPEALHARLRSNLGRLLGYGTGVFNDRAVSNLQLRGHAGLRASHLAVVRNMSVDGTRITELARRAGMTKQAMGQLVRELCEQGYLDLATDPIDRRAKRVTYTASGRQLALHAAESVTEVEAEFKQAMGKGGVKQLRKLLGRLVDAFGGG